MLRNISNKQLKDNANYMKYKKLQTKIKLSSKNEILYQKSNFVSNGFRNEY